MRSFGKEKGATRLKEGGRTSSPGASRTDPTDIPASVQGDRVGLLVYRIAT